MKCFRTNSHSSLIIIIVIVFLAKMITTTTKLYLFRHLIFSHLCSFLFCYYGTILVLITSNGYWTQSLWSLAQYATTPFNQTQFRIFDDGIKHYGDWVFISWSRTSGLLFIRSIRIWVVGTKKNEKTWGLEMFGKSRRTLEIYVDGRYIISSSIKLNH